MTYALKLLALIFLFVLSHAKLYAATTKASCSNILKIDKKNTIELGESLQVTHQKYSPGKTYSELIFLGLSTSESLERTLLIFTDIDHNIYTFYPEDTLIKGEPASRLDYQGKRLPRLIKQREGSCNLCAHVSAINQLALNEEKEPIHWSVEDMEESKTAYVFSTARSLRLLFENIYNSLWPKGYAPNKSAERVPEYKIQEFIVNYHLRIAHSMGKSFDFLDTELTDDQEAYIPIPVNLTSQRSYTAKIIAAHIKDGGVIVASGITDQSMKHKFINPEGISNQIAYSHLQAPQPLDQNSAEKQKEPVHSFRDSQKFREVFNMLKEGHRPDRNMVREFVSSMNEELYDGNKAQGLHAIALVKLIETGPLKNHIIAINSWGNFEVYPLEHFVDGLNYVLISAS